MADGNPRDERVAGTRAGTAQADGAADGSTQRTAVTREVSAHSRRPAVDEDRQREEYGGFNIGAAFFGWLVAIGVAVLLTAILSAAGAAIGLTELSDSEARSDADTISIVGGALLVLVLAIAYYAGGYVAGRMSRFDGTRQGIGVWVFGLLATVVLAIAGAVAGSEYNVLGQLNLPRIPIDEGDLATGGLIALAAVVLATLIAAALGGKAGEHYHRKVDEAGGIRR
jgi:MFS family permease